MKKIIFNILTVAAGVLIAASCSLLDIAPDGRETLEEIFADSDKTAAYLNSCYEDIHPKGPNYDWVCNAPTALSDEGFLVYGSVSGIATKLYNGSASASSHPFTADWDYYSSYLLQIRKCITFLQNIGKAKVNSEADRARWTAEAHVLKAHFMLELMKWFGKFGYEPDGFPNDYNYQNLKKLTPWEIAEYIAAECDAALAIDELPWIIDNNADCLRVTKALAWCIKSKAYLFAASPLHSEDFYEDEIADHWEVAYKVNKDAVKALEDHGYHLKTTVADTDVYKGPAAAYQELFGSPNLNTSNDMETIWKRSGTQTYYYHNYIGSRSNLRNAYRAGIVPTQELVDAYEVLSADGKTAEPLLNLTKPYNSDKSPNYNSKALALGYDANDPYKANRDPRMAVTVVKNGDKIFWDDEMVEVETFEGGDNGINDEPLTMNYTRTGYYFRKWVAPNADVNNARPSAAWKYFRLAEIKLNYAEAAAEANHLAEAKAQVDEIRARVSMPALPSNLKQDELIARIHNERMVELCYEECRYFDVRRWAESFETSALYKDFKLRCNKLTAMRITKNSDGTFTYKRTVGGDLVNASTKPRDLLLPIPQGEAETLYSLTGRRWQNTGW